MTGHVLRDLSDDELAERFKAGEVRAYEALCDRYYNEAYRIAYRIIGRHDAAEVACQESFLRLGRYISRFDTSRRFLPWFRAMVRNKSIDLLEQTIRDSLIESIDKYIDIGSSRDSVNQTLDDRIQLYQSLPQLSQSDQQLLILKYWDGLSDKEIGMRLGKKELTVHVNCFRARMRLKRVMTHDA